MTPDAELPRHVARRRLGVALVAACAALCCAADHAGLWRRTELKTLDWRFRTRDRLAPLAAETRRITLVEIDDESARRIPEPFILWDRHFAAVIEALSGSGAKAIAADVLWLKSVDEFLELKGESPRKALVRALLAAQKKTTLVLAALGDTGSSGAGRSLGKYAAAIGSRSFAIVNPVPDEDGVIRRQRPTYAVVGRDGRTERSPTFAFQAASALAPSPLDPGTERLIDFSEAAPPFDRLPFHEAVEKARAGDREYFRERFAGKVALIGTTSGLLDRLPTPLGPQTPGVWNLAFSIDSFLSARPLRPLGAWLQAAVTASLGIAAGALLLRLGPGLGVGAAAAILVAWLGLAQGLFHARRVAGVAGPVFSILLCAATAVMYRVVVADREKRKLKKALTGYVNPKLVEEALSADDIASILTGRRRRVAILFSDVRGFTKLSEKLPPEGVVRFLNRYLSAMSDIILDHGGTIDKFVGDGIMGFFGAPVERPDAAMAAIRVALAMQERLVALNAEWSAQGLPEIRVGVGIHAGDAVVGNIGSERKMDYTAIGDTTNLASRVESLTKDLNRPILITQPVFDEVGAAVEAEAMGVADVRGHAPIALYAVSRLKAASEVKPA